MKLMITILTGSYLAVMAVIDRRKKKIPVLPGILCTIVIVIAQIMDQAIWWQWVPGVLVGGSLYVVSKVTKGAIGEGDALVYSLTGVALGFSKNLELFILSLFFSALTAAILLVCRRVGRHTRIPFVPFTAVAYGMVMIV